MEERVFKFFTTTNNCISAICTGLTTIFGIQWTLFAAYMILNIIDFITGLIKARKTKTESSAIGIKGIIKKVCYWIVIVVAFLVSYIIVEIGKILNIDIQYVMNFGWFTLICMAINEGRSIIENLVSINIKVPKFLSKGLIVTNDLIDKAINQIVK